MAEKRPPGLAGGLTEYGDREFAQYLRRSFASAMGHTAQSLGKPVVGVLNTWSELNNCHRGLRELAEAVKRGVWQAGGLPLEFPVISLGEIFLSPTSMFLRNLMALDVEAMLRAQPLDAVVLMGGCDKTLPALLMGAASADVPAIVLAAGPMLTGSHEGERIGACTDCRRFWAAYRRGELERATIDNIEGQLAPTAGTCGVMGTASTMACLSEAMGMMLPGGAAIPAVHADRLRHGERSGIQAVALAHKGLKPSQIMTESAFDNALRVLQAIGGSTNAVIHLTAIAGRLGIKLELDRLDAMADSTPVLVGLKPSGAAYMEDFHRAGGLPVVLQALRGQLHGDCLTVTGATLGEQLAKPFEWPDWQDVIRPPDDPLQEQGALIALHGSLAPDGSVLKRSAASPALLQSEARAVVFSSLTDLAARIDDPALDVRPDDCLLLQNAGPLGGPGMPEAGYLPIPRKLGGQRDMLRISDARMSGTAFGTIVLHVAPEAALGGPLGLVRSGDRVRLDAQRRRLDLLVDERELLRRGEEARHAAPLAPTASRGYERLYRESVQQAQLGVDFDFLRHESLQGG
ncbi:MAG: dihydroxy-acid dehydratase [Anaerolineaceae bacterium]|nr:dihydroxy-acid dehydratase [Anaerolineaceae bacterium]